MSCRLLRGWKRRRNFPLSLSLSLSGDLDTLANRTNLENLYHEETLWSQCARWKWFKEGDPNAPFSHKMVNMRHRRNNIASLKDGGNVVSNQAIISLVADRYFGNLYGLEASVSWTMRGNPYGPQNEQARGKLQLLE